LFDRVNVLEINDTTNTDTVRSASYLDLHLWTDSGSRKRRKLYVEKKDDLVDDTLGD